MPDLPRSASSADTGSRPAIYPLRELRQDGVTVWHLQRVKLYEVSICTFPAYEDTHVSARQAQREELSKNRLDDWKASMRAKIHKEG